MLLADYLKVHDFTLAGFGERIGVSPEAVRRYIGGERIPTKDIMARIREATSGAVQANDFFDGASAPAAKGKAA